MLRTLGCVPQVLGCGPWAVGPRLRNAVHNFLTLTSTSRGLVPLLTHRNCLLMSCRGYDPDHSHVPLSLMKVLYDVCHGQLMHLVSLWLQDVPP